MSDEKWYPQPKQESFLKSPAFELGFGGAKGPGKTDALIVDGASHLRHPYYKSILFRRTTPQLEEIYIRTLKWFTAAKAAWNGIKNCWVFPNRARFYLAHCQYEKDKQNHQGQEYNWMGFDQLEQFTRTMYEFLKMQVRTTNPNFNCYVRATFNPGGIGHSWVKKHFVDACPHDGTIVAFVRGANDEYVKVPIGTPDSLTRAFIFSTIHDNKYILDNYPEYLANLRSLPEAQRRAMEMGDWDAFEGQFFSEFYRPLHVIPYTEFKHGIYQVPVTRFISLDYGYAKPASVHFHAVLPEGKLRTYKEIYVTGRTYESLAAEVKRAIEPEEEFDYMVCDPAIQGDKSHHRDDAGIRDGDIKGESGYDIMKREMSDICPVLLGDNRRVVGWTRMHEYLKPFTNQFGQRDAFWKITSNCVNLIRTLPEMIFATNDPEDVDTSGEDHAPDDCRYAIMTRPEIPVEIKRRIDPNERFWERVKIDINKKKAINSLQSVQRYANNEPEIEEGEVFIDES
jgi:hypothetical protein